MLTLFRFYLKTYGFIKLKYFKKFYIIKQFKNKKPLLKKKKKWANYRHKSALK